MGKPSSNQRVALVTGAASGIGLAIAQRLSADGHFVIGVDRTETVVQSMTEISGEGRVADLLAKDVVRRVIDDVVASPGRLDVLVNCAGAIAADANGAKSSETISEDEWEAVLAINLTTPFLLSKYALPLLKESAWGRIVNISSRTGRMAVAGVDPAYTVTKTGLIGMTRQMALEFASTGLTVNAIAPGTIGTPGIRGLGGGYLERVAKEIPVGRIAEPAEVAGMASYLCSEEAGFVTGAVMDINGGLFMG